MAPIEKIAGIVIHMVSFPSASFSHLLVVQPTQTTRNIMNNYPLRSKKRAEGQVWDLTEDSDDDIVAKNYSSNKKSRSCKNTKPTRKDCGDGAPTAIMKPELVTSSDGNNDSSKIAFDEEDFEKLRQRYLLPRIQLNTELPTGMTLRRTFKPRLIDLKTPGFQRLRVRIDKLTKKNDWLAVYRLLCQVRRYEIDPSRVPAVMQETNHCGDVNEVFDLTQDNDDVDGKECFNVDEYITDVLLPRDETDSRPDFVLSTSSKSEKVENNAMLYPKKECTKEEQSEPKNVTDKGVVIEAQEIPSTPKTTHRVAQVTPEKPLDLNGGAVVRQVSASTSRSSTPTVALQVPVKSIVNSVYCGIGDHYQKRGAQHLHMGLQRNNVLEQVYRMKRRDKAVAKRATIVLDSKVQDRDVLFGNTLGKMTKQRNNICVMNVSMKPPPRVSAAPNKPSQQLSLAKEWRSQTRRRRKGGESYSRKELTYTCIESTNRKLMSTWYQSGFPMATLLDDGNNLHWLKTVTEILR